jgi:hypothetical protein
LSLSLDEATQGRDQYRVDAELALREVGPVARGSCGLRGVAPRGPREITDGDHFDAAGGEGFCQMARDETRLVSQRSVRLLALAAECGGEDDGCDGKARDGLLAAREGGMGLALNEGAAPAEQERKQDRQRDPTPRG